ncbi:acyl carrier protein [Amycolatopsis australiensis]|uniref:Acyl carrier protein n=1 Tax=Amycolatopsis australiensis TaxID=546364 RepID=A0A1K1SAU4_9PSEU|nr:acyl carrier protein [Amycolatopsis australiensis]SFW81422.1 acyl carrier protein [Amycolatopsis australiensis]
MTGSVAAVADLLSRHLDEPPAAGITAATRLEDDLGLNSAQVVDLLSELEDRFGCVVEDDDLDTLERVGDLAAVIDRAGAR